MLSTSIGKLWWVLLFLLPLTSEAALSGNKNHVVVHGGIVHLQGKVSAGACAVSPDSEDKMVNMGQVRSNQFAGVGSWADPVPFTLYLVDCDTALSKQVGMIFTGVTAGKDPLVFSTGRGPGAAQGIGIGLFDAQNRLIVPNSRPRYFTPLHDGVVAVPFTAKYRATSDKVTPGDASAVVDFSLYYP